MKAVAAALVLIAGAAVVLWYSNTLNSWVLGGLIGGLAALLLSIPISLTLFSYLSRRHDERLKAEKEASRVRVYDSLAVPPRRVRRVYEAQGYALPDGQSLNDEAYYQPHDNRYDRHVQTAHHLPVPSPQRFPVQSQPSGQLTGRAPIARPSTRQLPGDMPSVEQRDSTTRRTTTRRMNYPGFPGSVPGYSKHRSEALRAARREAAQHHDDDVDVLPTHLSRPLPSARRLSQSLATQTDRLQPQRIDEEVQSHHRSRSLSPTRESAVHDGPLFSTEPQTDSWDADDYPQTGPMQQLPQTDHLYGYGQSASEASSEITTGNLTRPLVRRAPYLYADDTLRKELAQQVEGPIVRRSSRLEGRQQSNDHDDYNNK
jgi:hypothetical protein